MCYWIGHKIQEQDNEVSLLTESWTWHFICYLVLVQPKEAGNPPIMTDKLGLTFLEFIASMSTKIQTNNRIFQESISEFSWNGMDNLMHLARR